MTGKSRTGVYDALVSSGALSMAELRKAEESAHARGVEPESVLIREAGVPRTAVLAALSEHYGLPAIEYDERMPVPPELLEGLEGERLAYRFWFPVIKDGDAVVIAAGNPEDPAMNAEAARHFGGQRLEFRVALKEDILRYIQDYLHARVGLLIGTERTGLAYWRNTMAHWRSRLACYRSDLARVRTDLASLRAGLGLVAISDALMRADKAGTHATLYLVLLAAGLGVAAFGLAGYLRLRRSKISPPGHQTTIEVTSATMSFLEDYHFIDTGVKSDMKKTMLGRLGDFIAGHSTILYPSPASRERTHLARERNVLAGQRTVAAAYRTVYARARTGLAFIRTGVSFVGIGVGLVGYYGFGPMSVVDAVLVAAGMFMAVDGVLWYMPVRREQAELPRCIMD